MKKWGLITIVDDKGKVLVHRTRLKVIINPILRKFGWSIVSVIDDEKEEFVKYWIMPYPKYCKVIK